MNWKQLHTTCTPAERLEAVLLMLRAIEMRPEVVVIYIDVRKILLRLASLGMLGLLTLASAFITLHGDPALVAPALTFYLTAFLYIFIVKTKRPEAHYLRADQ